jgi:hypothetical protein
MLFSEKDERIEKYKRIRRVAQQLTDRLQKHLPKFALVRAAKDLDFMGPKGILTFDLEEETSFFIDRCFFDIYWEGKNLIGHFIESDDYEQLTAEEQLVVQGMTQTYYSLFENLEVNRSEATLKLVDLLGEETFTITDINMSQTASEGYIQATRISKKGDIYMTTGASCPFAPNQKEILIEGLRKRTKRVGKKRKSSQILKSSDYSAYFFRQYKRISKIRFSSVEGIE